MDGLVEMELENQLESSVSLSSVDVENVVYIIENIVDNEVQETAKNTTKELRKFVQFSSEVTDEEAIKSFNLITQYENSLKP